MTDAKSKQMISLVMFYLQLLHYISIYSNYMQEITNLYVDKGVPKKKVIKEGISLTFSIIILEPLSEDFPFR